MNTVRIYIDEDLDQQKRTELESFIREMSHVVDVGIGKNEPHEVVIEFEEHHNMPMMLIERLRAQGFHPDIISA